MRFTFSKDFRQSDYASLLQKMGVLMERLRLNSGSNVKAMMAELHVSHPTLRKY